MDHKRIGVMYIVLALVMLVRGFADAIMMRAQQVLAEGSSAGYLPPHHFDQIFSAHGTIMILFMAMPFLVGLWNIVIPQQLGARDVAYSFLNSVSFWLIIDFDTDEHGTFDMKPFLDFGLFQRLKDRIEFERVRVAFDTIEWDGGIDLDPEFVYDKCLMVNT